MTFPITFTDVHNPHLVYDAELDVELSDDEVARIAQNYRDTLEELDCNDEDDAETDLLDMYGMVVFFACPELEARFDAALAPCIEGEEEFANGHYWAWTERWCELNDAGVEFTVPVLNFSNLPEEIKHHNSHVSACTT